MQASARKLLLNVIASGMSMIAVAQYSQHNLVSNGFVPADHTDSQLRNPWGIAFSPTSPYWIADDQSNASTLYDGAGVKQSLVVDTPIFPSGVAWNGSTDFVISNGTTSGPASFIFCHEGGQISAWRSSVTGTTAVTMIDRSNVLADYTGVAVLTGGATGSRIYAANFVRARGVDMFDASFNFIGTFKDPTIPETWAPFNVQAFGTSLYVTYAFLGVNGDPVTSAGLGIVDEFDAEGHLIRRIVSNGELNAPWGLARAPATFGQFAGDLLVGNFGDGVINAYDPVSGAFHGTLRDTTGHLILNDKLWGISFGSGARGFDPNSLYFVSAGPNEIDGLLGRIDAVPEPATLAFVGIGLSFLLKRRKR